MSAAHTVIEHYDLILAIARVSVEITAQGISAYHLLKGKRFSLKSREVLMGEITRKTHIIASGKQLLLIKTYYLLFKQHIIYPP